MMDVKDFVKAALDLARADMADGSDYRPHAYFLLPDGKDEKKRIIEIVVIDPNFMASPEAKDRLEAMLLAHLQRRGALYGVLVSDAWGATASFPAGTTVEQARAALPEKISNYAGRTELLTASIFGEGMAPMLARWPYTRVHGKPVFKDEDLEYESEASGTIVTGRFAFDLRRGRPS